MINPKLTLNLLKKFNRQSHDLSHFSTEQVWRGSRWLHDEGHLEDAVIDTPSGVPCPEVHARCLSDSGLELLEQFKAEQAE